jgi:hypothetical protein
MIKSLPVLLLISIIIQSCTNSGDRIIRKYEDGTIMEGLATKDSLFNGRVNCYDSIDNTLLWYSNYRYGIRNGVTVQYYKNGVISDSMFYQNGNTNGFAYKFDSSGKLLYKVFYVNNRLVGHTYDYDSTGEVSDYTFTDFDDDILFYSWREKDGSFYTYNSPSYIDSKIYQYSDNGIKKYGLLLYLLSPPGMKSHYELAIRNQQNQILSSAVIDSSNCFYEQPLDSLSNGNQYAIVFHEYNTYKKRDDVYIRGIEIDSTKSPEIDTMYSGKILRVAYIHK